MEALAPSSCAAASVRPARACLDEDISEPLTRTTYQPPDANDVEFAELSQRQRPACRVATRRTNRFRNSGMNSAVPKVDADLSLFAVGTLLLRQRWRVIRWTIGCGILALSTVMFRPPVFRATASFAPQGGDASKSNLASIAGQFGVAIPSGGQTLSPEYYARLVKSRTLLRAIALESYPVQDSGGRRIPFLDLFQIPGGDQSLREDLGIEQLTKLVGTAVSKPTGIVEVSAQTRWRSVSLSLVAAILARVNEFNQQSRQSQAGAERKFVERRMALADSELRGGEDRLRQFIQANRQVSNSPELSLERERLARVISQRQQVYTTLAQSYEEARIREVRDTPVITVVESPSVPARYEPRGRAKVALLGLMIGAFIGGLLVVGSAAMARRRAAGDEEATAFASALGDATSGIVTPLRRISGKGRS